MIVLSKRSLIESRICNGKQKKKNELEDAAHKGENKSLVGPLKSLGTLGKYPPSQWA